VESLITNILVR